MRTTELISCSSFLSPSLPRRVVLQLSPATVEKTQQPLSPLLSPSLRPDMHRLTISRSNTAVLMSTSRSRLSYESRPFPGASAR
jgi:hypothetical protein